MCTLHIIHKYSHNAFLKNVKEPFATNALNNITYIENLSITDKIQIGDMLKEKVNTFYNANKEKYRWLISKYVALWFINATAEQI